MNNVLKGINRGISNKGTEASEVRSFKIIYSLIIIASICSLIFISGCITNVMGVTGTYIPSECYRSGVDYATYEKTWVASCNGPPFLASMHIKSDGTWGYSALQDGTWSVNGDLLTLKSEYGGSTDIYRIEMNKLTPDTVKGTPLTYIKVSNDPDA
ncbi:MAG: hypothetical protein WCX22_07270 [Methanoregula sp.]